jgi:hypothetical protein
MSANGFVFGNKTNIWSVGKIWRLIHVYDINSNKGTRSVGAVSNIYGKDHYRDFFAVKRNSGGRNFSGGRADVKVGESGCVEGIYEVGVGCIGVYSRYS